MHAKTGYKTQEKYDDIANKNYRLQNGRGQQRMFLLSSPFPIS